MENRQNIELCYDANGRMLNEGDNVIVLNETSGNIYKVISITSNSLVVRKDDGTTATYSTSVCMKI